MAASQLDHHSLFNINKRKNELLEEIEKDIDYLKDNNIELNIDTDSLRESKHFGAGDIKYGIEFRDQFADLDYFQKIKPLLNQIPVSNGSSYYKKIDVNIGIIADEFLFNSFKDVAHF